MEHRVMDPGRRSAPRSSSWARVSSSSAVAHVVRTGHFPPGADRLFSRLQKFREETDYAEVYVADEAGTRRDLQDAQGLVSEVEKALGT